MHRRGVFGVKSPISPDRSGKRRNGRLDPNGRGGDQIGTGLVRLFGDDTEFGRPRTFTYTVVEAATGSSMAARAVDDGIPFLGLAAGAGGTVKSGLTGNTAPASRIPNLSNSNRLQSGETPVTYKYSKSPELGEYSSIDELMATGHLPGDYRAGGGVVLTDRTVRFGDVYELGTLGGRRVEFSLTSEVRDGRNVKVLYSGTERDVVVPRNARVLGHVHPTPHELQRFPSPGDMETFNNIYFRQLEANPAARPQPTRIFWGPGNLDNTIFYPGFGKAPIPPKEK